jgi:hypothetical protein
MSGARRPFSYDPPADRGGAGRIVSEDVRQAQSMDESDFSEQEETVAIRRIKRKEGDRMKIKEKKIFSGDYSADMWDEINNAKTIADLRNALYFVCCRLQEFESRVEGLK